MQFVQPRELNSFVDSTIPLTWNTRWRVLKPLLPILLGSSVILAEQLAFRIWLEGKSLLAALPWLLVCLALPLASILLLFELVTRSEHRTSRSIKLEPKRVSISPARCNRIRWSQIGAWRMEPVPVEEQSWKLTMEYAFGRRLRRWSMVLSGSDQKHAFLSELEHYRQLGLNKASLTQSPEQLPPTKVSGSLRSSLAVGLGLYFLLHGMPILCVGLMPGNKRSTEENRHSSFTPAEREKFRRVVVGRFHSFAEFRACALVLGGTLSSAGAVLYFCGLKEWRRSSRHPASEKQLSLTSAAGNSCR